MYDLRDNRSQLHPQRIIYVISDTFSFLVYMDEYMVLFTFFGVMRDNRLFLMK